MSGRLRARGTDAKTARWSFLLLLLPALLCTCRSLPAPDSGGMPARHRQSPAGEIAEDVRRWADCVIQMIRELDDGRADVASVAGPARRVCRRYYVPKNDEDVRLVTKAVLQWRAARATATKTSSGS
jgi:hypothetical protein